MKPFLPLFVFVDACGWEIIKDHPFARNHAPERRKLRSVFGYSSACIPSILSGRWPAEHRNWCYFVYDPQHSPFRSLRHLRWLPRALTSRRIFRHRLSLALEGAPEVPGLLRSLQHPLRAHFPIRFLGEEEPLQPNGLNRGPNIFDHMQASAASPGTSAIPSSGERQNLDNLLADIKRETDRLRISVLARPGRLASPSRQHLAGGPGQAATPMSRGSTSSWPAPASTTRKCG